MIKNGFLIVGRYRGAPIRFHWTLPLGALFFGQFRFAPSFWAAFVLLILLHEIGHAYVVRRCRQRVLAIDVHGFGGLCHWDGSVTPLQRACIAWGGVWAQGLLYVATQASLLFTGPPHTLFALELVSAFTTTNLYLIALNLLPVPPLDGAEAWRLVPILRERMRARAARRRRERARRRADEEMRDLDALEVTPPIPRPDDVDARTPSPARTKARKVAPSGADAAVDALFEKLERERALKRGVRSNE